MNLEVLNIQKIDGKPQLKAFADVMINSIIRVNGFRLMESSKDGFWVGFPSIRFNTKDGKVKYNNIVETTSDSLKEEIKEAIILAYNR